MIVFLLIIITTNAEIHYLNGPPTETLIVSDTYSAAMEVFTREHHKRMFDNINAKLYEVNLDSLSIKEMALPILQFSDSAAVSHGRK